MTALNVAIRKEIIENVISKGTTIPKQKEDLTKRTQTRVREICMTRVPKEFDAAVKNLPKEWFPHTVQIEMSPNVSPITRMNMDMEERRRHWRTSISFDPPIKHPYGVRFDRPNEARKYNDTKDDPESWEILLAPLITEANEIFETEQSLKNQLKNFLASVKNYKQIIEKMPELEDHLPNHTKPMPLVVQVAPILKALDQVGFDQTKPKKKTITRKKK